MKSKMLFLANQNPYPPVDGGKLSIYYPLIKLSEYFDIFFISPLTPNIDKNHLKEINNHYKKYNIKYLPYFHDTTNDYKYIIKNVFKKLPFKWDKYYLKAVQNTVNNLVLKEDIKYIWVSAPHMAKYAIEAKKVKNDIILILREHNIEYMLVKQYGEINKDALIKLISYWQLMKVKPLELFYWKNFDHIFFISDLDYNIALENAKELNNKFHVIYDGFDIINDEINISKNNYFILPTNFKAPQNILSFKWFLYKIWLPVIDKIKEKNIKLFITGEKTDLIRKIFRIKDFSSINIEILGFVDNINKEIIKYKYVLSPTIIGSGIRLKMLNGMACGKPVFLTELDYLTCNKFKDMGNVVFFRNEEEFIKKLEILENNNDLYINICKNASRIIKDYFNWDLYIKKFINLINYNN